MIRLRLLLAAALVAGCRPNSTRPPFQPYPEAVSTEVRLVPQEATRHLAEAMAADSVPLARVRLRDAYLETPWIDSATGRATRRRPVGTSVVRIRAWADPARPGNSRVTVETLYRPFADPSLPERELEHQVPATHPMAVKVGEVLKSLVERYGGPPPPAPPAARPGAEPDQEAEPPLEE